MTGSKKTYDKSQQTCPPSKVPTPAMRPNVQFAALPGIVNCRLQEQLNDDDLYGFTANNDTTGITPENLKSFENADIVLRANHRDTGEIHYIAIEASFTGGEDDTRRALRNARYLTRFTGQPAHAVVAALHLTPEAEAAISQGDVIWYETERRHLEPA